MSEYETLGHMEPIWDTKEEDGYYTPHHGVLSSNKFRVVFNASARATTEITLNETQLIGEKLQDVICLRIMEINIILVERNKYTQPFSSMAGMHKAFITYMLFIHSVRARRVVIMFHSH